MCRHVHNIIIHRENVRVWTREKCKKKSAGAGLGGCSGRCVRDVKVTAETSCVCSNTHNVYRGVVNAFGRRKTHEDDEKSLLALDFSRRNLLISLETKTPKRIPPPSLLITCVSSDIRFLFGYYFYTHLMSCCWWWTMTIATNDYRVTEVYFIAYSLKHYKRDERGKTLRANAFLESLLFWSVLSCGSPDILCNVIIPHCVR